MKTSTEQINLMKKLNQEGKSQVQISNELHLPKSKVSYWIGEGNRERAIKKSRERFLKLSKVQKKKYYESRREYLRNYVNRRYKDDETFRNKLKERSKVWKRKKHEQL